MDEQTETATPRPGSVRDSYGDPCSRATSDSYPLSARCANCGADIRCADGQAQWAHKRTRQFRCYRDTFEQGVDKLNDRRQAEAEAAAIAMLRGEV